MTTNLTDDCTQPQKLLIEKLYAMKVPDIAMHRERLAFGLAVQGCVEIVKAHEAEQATMTAPELTGSGDTSPGYAIRKDAYLGAVANQTAAEDERRNLKKACNHLERMRSRINRVVNVPMSINKMAEELDYISKQAHIAHQRITEMFLNKTNLSQRMELSGEYLQFEK